MSESVAAFVPQINFARSPLAARFLSRFDSHIPRSTQVALSVVSSAAAAPFQAIDYSALAASVPAYKLAA